jgi:two-component system, NtrC family, response regulator HydG
MKSNSTFLVIDDNKDILTAVEMLTRDYFQTVLTSLSPEQLPSLLCSRKIDIILLDMNFRSSINSGNEGLYWLREIKRLSPDTKVVLFTAYADVNLAVTGMKEGAADFIVKPFDNKQLLETLLKTHVKAPSKQKESNNEPAMFWGTSPAMENLRLVVEKIARTDANVLITGENGTGKELLAREIHYLSLRNDGPMIAVDMGAVTESLFESELFGHLKGSFTDAKSDHAGKFEVADGGSLFMDEIGNLPYQMQAKLLRVLQQRRIVRVGDTKAIPINIRLICATNRDLPQMVSEGSFREDLLYRINTIHLELPALRDRKEDIPALAKLFLKKIAKQYNKPEYKLLPDACIKLSEQPWYGNIRELEHVVEKAVIMSDHQELGAKDFDCPTVGNTSISSNANLSLEDMEKSFIQAAIRNCDGNLSKVSQQLGVSRQTLYNKLKRYGL